MERAFQTLVARHEMLRAVVSADGAQRVLEQVPTYRVAVADLTGQPPERVEDAITATRAAMDHKVYQPSIWPLFELRITHTGSGSLLHFSLDFLIADFVSIQVLVDELHTLYTGADALPPLEITYRDYLLAEWRLRDERQGSPGPRLLVAPYRHAADGTGASRGDRGHNRRGGPLPPAGRTDRTGAVGRTTPPRQHPPDHAIGRRAHRLGLTRE